ncbi:MAG: hypothetical protein IJ733_06105, partial [Lachnospiraceae bacterium]|nr:hypothetical protein [Lachnospiraceae bacterium]
MEIINGNFASAKIFHVKNFKVACEEYAKKQLRTICDNPVSKGSNIREKAHLLSEEFDFSELFCA